jgi:hypothetical protein
MPVDDGAAGSRRSRTLQRQRSREAAGRLLCAWIFPDSAENQLRRGHGTSSFFIVAEAARKFIEIRKRVGV